MQFFDDSRVTKHLVRWLDSPAKPPGYKKSNSLIDCWTADPNSDPTLVRSPCDAIYLIA